MASPAQSRDDSPARPIREEMMSTFAYYDFRAIDRPLSVEEQAELRKASSRALISANKFAVSYSYGRFKGDADEWMEKYFDAHLYCSNWGQALQLRLPAELLPSEIVRRYCQGEAAWFMEKGDSVILGFGLEYADSEWIDEASERERLDLLLGLRAELAAGDLRPLYLAWLHRVLEDELEDEDEEPPCPPGLGSLSVAQREFASFLALDDHLIAVAAEASPGVGWAKDPAELERFVSVLPSEEKDKLLTRLLAEGEAFVRAELMGRFRAQVEGGALPPQPRTVEELLKKWKARQEASKRREAEQKALEAERLRRTELEARREALLALAPREAEAWQKVDALIATTVPARYNEAISLLTDLRDLAEISGRQNGVAERLATLAEAHAKKPSFIQRLRKAGLIT